MATLPVIVVDVYPWCYFTESGRLLSFGYEIFIAGHRQARYAARRLEAPLIPLCLN